MASLIDELDAVRRLAEGPAAKRRRVGEGVRAPGLGADADGAPPAAVDAELAQAVSSAFQALMSDAAPDVAFPADATALFRAAARRRPDILRAGEAAGVATLEAAAKQYLRAMGPAHVRLERIELGGRLRLLVHRPGAPRPRLRAVVPRRPARKPAMAADSTPAIPLRVVQPTDEEAELEALIDRPTAGEAAGAGPLAEVAALLDRPTAKEALVRRTFQSKGRVYFREYCFWGTKDDCRAARRAPAPCSRVHFRKIVKPHTDHSLGDCSYLNTCHRLETCKFLHYDIDDEELATIEPAKLNQTLMPITRLWPAQWLNCDIRKLDFSVLGKFSVIMADPPWDIHMSLPYGTMTDDEMRQMPIAELQDDGFIFLWVTGRAMELGRECLSIWGYDRVGELLWIKTNQLQRLIRTGRTGHWLNHSKEHCLVGVKGRPAYNGWVDADVLVAEVRETSRKPDEVYGLIDRLCPNSRKIEIFGRMHNTRDGWMTLGNQLDGVRIYEPDVLERYNRAHPEAPAELSKF
ncbi:N6-adenosine-methyltransferase 70 kDa subunit [Hyaloraphidium curvatum]|nr:N6-adenosine-methyltransferase 70 kDa subunit [Hyaloraphidium curvatum]